MTVTYPLNFIVETGDMTGDATGDVTGDEEALTEENIWYALTQVVVGDKQLFKVGLITVDTPEQLKYLQSVIVTVVPII